jgi:hypothetical protein
MATIGTASTGILVMLLVAVWLTEKGFEDRSHPLGWFVAVSYIWSSSLTAALSG